MAHSESILIMKKIIETYNTAFAEFGDDTKSVLWTKGQQSLRFKALLKHFNLKGVASLLDHGCGLAHLKHYLDQSNFTVEYSGTDINETFLNHCKKKYPKSNFFLAGKSTEKFDIIVSSGAFNMLYVEDKTEHQKLVFSELSKLFSLCNIGISINFMTDQVDFQQKGAFHQNPLELSEFIRKNLSKRFILDHSYMPYEFTLTVFKQLEVSGNIYAD